jgi:hypothetical protein
MSAVIKTWRERMPAPRIEYRCAMNCWPRNPGQACGDCMSITVHGDPIAARDAEIAELRAELATRCYAEGGDTSKSAHGCHWSECPHGEECIHAKSGAAPASGTEKDVAIESIIDHIADNWPMKKYSLEEIEIRLRAEIAAIAAHTKARKPA